MPLETYPNHHLDGDGGTDTAIAATSGRKVAQTVDSEGHKRGESNSRWETAARRTAAMRLLQCQQQLR